MFCNFEQKFKLITMKTELLERKLTKSEVLERMIETNFSSRKMVEKIEELINLSDNGNEKEKTNALNALYKINILVDTEYSEAIEQTKLLKLLKEFSGVKGAKLEVADILNSGTIFGLLQKIEDLGYVVSLTTNFITIGNESLEMYSAHGESFEDTAKNGICEFLLKRG